MRIIVSRRRKTTDGLFGVLTLDFNSFTCFTVENLAMAILAGTYPVVYQYSPHFNKSMPHITVPGRTCIMIHWANNPVGKNPAHPELEGCVGVGDKEEPDAVDDSIITFNKLDALIKPLSGLTIEVQDIPVEPSVA